MHTTVTISSDPATLGHEATTQDVLRYGGNLASLLTEEFDTEIEVEFALVASSRVACPHSPQLEDAIYRRVETIEQGDEWTLLLFGDES